MIKPAGHRVLVRPLEIETKSAGGILLVDDKRKQEAQIKGELVAVGPNAWKAFDGGEPWAKVGEIVYFAQYGGYKVRDGETEYRLLNDEDICAVETANG